MQIHLIGPGGAGKSTTGGLLAERLGIPFIDLDVCFMAAHGDISDCIHSQGYAAYAACNIDVYLTALVQASGQAVVLALSSGFMAYSLDVHPGYAACREAILKGASTFVLLPALDRNTCIQETVRRQLNRPFARSAEREAQVIRSRFDLYRQLPVVKIETSRPPADIVKAISAQLDTSIGGMPAHIC